MGIDSSDYSDEEIDQAFEEQPFLWCLKNQLKNETGHLIDFEKRKFQVDMLNDMSPNQAMLKPPQIGLTLLNLIKTFFVAKKLKRDIIYTLPTQGDVNDMAGGKINRIIAQNPVLGEWTKDHDTVEQKQVGDNLIYYRGTFISKQAMMVSSGLNVHDEVDASDPEVISQYETRLQAQDDGGWRWYFSHPSLAGHGVDVYWQQSDMKEWYVTCANGHEHVMTWPDSIDREKQIYICKECKVELSDEDRIAGRWINKDGVAWDGVIVGDYKFSGWHVSQMMLYNKSARDIIEAFLDPTKNQQYFYNYVLGLPYVSSDDRIEPAVVLRNCVDKVNPRTSRTIIGVDTGHGLHYVLLNKEGLFYYEHVTEITAKKDPYDTIRKHLNSFPRSIAVFDQGGDLIGPRKLVQEYPGRIFLCFYNKDRKTVELVDWGEGEEWWKVRVDRNRMMTLVVEQLRDLGRIVLNGTKEEWYEFASHFGFLYREKMMVKETRGKDNSELYGVRYVWKRNGPDHFAHALLYAIVGLQRYGGEPAKIVADSALSGLPVGRVAQVAKEETIVAAVSPADFRSENRVF